MVSKQGVKYEFIIYRCFNGGQCIDGVDTYNCNCQDGYFGNNCECPPEAVDDPSLCLNVNESVSWEVRNCNIGKAIQGVHWNLFELTPYKGVSSQLKAVW